jgi:hypothetical protein
MKTLSTCIFTIFSLLAFANESHQKEITLEDHASKSLDQRRADYGSYSPALRSSLWKQHFEVTLFTEDLDEIQVDFVLYMISLIENGFLMHDQSDPLYDLKVLKTAGILLETAEELFTRDQIHRIFATLGSTHPNHLEIQTSQKLDPCQCSSISNTCGGTSSCFKADRFACFPVAIGCGFTGIFPCDGFCT